MKLAVMAAIAAMFGTAHAGVITYQMTFKSDAGAVIGAGQVSYDPGVVSYAIKDYSQTCIGTVESCGFSPSSGGLDVGPAVNIATLVLNIAGNPFGATDHLHTMQGSLYTGRGILFGPVSDNFTVGAWVWGGLNATTNGAITIPDLSGAIAMSTFYYYGQAGNLTGTVLFERLSEIPLPSAILAFGMGLIGLGLYRRSGSKQARISDA